MRAILGHCLGYTSWRSLAAEGVSDEDMADLVVDWLHGVEAGNR